MVMKKLIIAILIAACSSGHVAAQKLKIISATKQSWSGGVAGHHGTNYSIVIKTNEKIKFDSVYTNGMGFQLNPPQGSGRALYDSIKHTYTISFSEFHDDMNPYPNPLRVKSSAAITPPPVRTYNGETLLIYGGDKKQMLLVKQMNSLRQLCYP